MKTAKSPFAISKLDQLGPFLGPRRDVEFPQWPVVARDLKYLEEAVVDAEGAARWHAERDPTAAVRFRY